MGIFSALAPSFISGGSSLLGGFMTNRSNRKINNNNMIFNSAQSAIQRKFNSEEAQKDRDWQEMMSSTATSRAMADMRNAGLNPILAGGMQSPMGGGATAQAAMASAPNMIPMQDALTPAVNSALSASRTSSDVALNKAREGVARAEETLKSNLIPGSESISILAQEVKELMVSVRDILNENGKSYKGMLNQASELLGKFIDKGAQLAGDKGTVINIYKNAVKEVGNNAVQFIEDSVRDFNYSIQ